MGGRIEDLVAAQLGRPPRGLRTVAVWCPFGFPAVVETRPYLEDGTPFPTLFYLSCPSAVVAVGRREAEEGVRRLRVLLRRDADAAEALRQLEALYRERRREVAPEGPRIDGGAVLQGGIGGVADLEGLSCLHAVAAALLVAGTHYPGLVTSPPPTATVVGTWRDLLDGFGELWCAAADCRVFQAPASAPIPGGSTERSDGSADRPPRLAVIDVGTMSTRLLVADLVDGRPQDVVRRTVITRLGESLDGSGRLLPAARERTTRAVSEFVAESRAQGARSIMALGTSAVREATDGEEYLHGLGHACGAPVLVASGELEARLAYAGATLDVPTDPMLLDIGGGSTELVCRGADGSLQSVSLRLGSVRSTERWLRHDPPLASELAALREEAEELLGPVAERLARGEAPAAREPGASVPRAAPARPGADGGEAPGGDRSEAPGPGTGPTRPSGAGAAAPPSRVLVGVAGTVTTLACLHLALESYDRSSVHLSTITRASLDRHLIALAAVPAPERRRLTCMQPGREDVIVAGAEILRSAMAVLGYEEIVVSERDLLDGMVLHAEELQQLAGG